MAPRLCYRLLAYKWENDHHNELIDRKVMDRNLPATRRFLFMVSVFVLSLISGVRNGEPQDHRPFAPAPIRRPAKPERRSENSFAGGPNQFGLGGRASIEEYYKELVEQLFRVTGRRDEPRSKSFDPEQWNGVESLVRVERPGVPILGKRGWGGATIEIVGVADAGEILALLDVQNVVAIPNPLGQHPDESGTWYHVRLLDGKNGWICAVPLGGEASPFARAFKNDRGKLGELVDKQVPRTGNGASGASDSRLAIENARSRGADAGCNDGRRAGDAEGFEIGFKAGEESSYRQILSELYSSDNYHRIPIYSFVVTVVAFLLGFALQYVMIYLLRAGGFFHHIDGIVRPERAIERKLRHLSEHGR